MKKYHSFHLVEMSPWPMVCSFMVMSLAFSFIMWIQYMISFYILFFMLFSLWLVMMIWWRDVYRESNFVGNHSYSVEVGLKIGMILFIVSEVLFFFSFFWTFFQSGISPSFEIGMKWPPVGIEAFNPLHVPFLNTVLLLSSGVTVTWSHHAMVKNNIVLSQFSLFMTILLGVLFTFCQWLEYKQAKFGFWDSVYGSIFFLSTGFHGFHVILGTIFLISNLEQMGEMTLSNSHHAGFEMAAWYWHFVDVVWLFLYVSVYWWSYYI